MTINELNVKFDLIKTEINQRIINGNYLVEQLYDLYDQLDDIAYQLYQLQG
jgi:hypothetical protein